MHIQHVRPVADLFQIQDTRLAGQDKEKWAKGRTGRLCVSRSSLLLLTRDLVTDLSPKVTWMKCKTYSSSMLDVRSSIILINGHGVA